MKFSSLCFLLFCLAGCQERTADYTVIKMDGSPVPNAQIRIIEQSSTEPVELLETNKDGKASGRALKAWEHLQIQATGFESQELKADPRDRYKIYLRSKR